MRRSLRFGASAEPDAIETARHWAAEGRVDQKILEDNPKAFYGI